MNILKTLKNQLTRFFRYYGFAVVMAVIIARPAAAGIFEAPFPLDDTANMWLNHIFNGGDFTFLNHQIGTTYGLSGANHDLIPRILNAIAGMYSTCMLVVATIILVYHLIAMVAQTAHEGVVMGKSANQIWAPIRLVFALGLLVPISDGWSSGQWLVVQIAKWGSGMASNIWHLNANFPTYIMDSEPDLTGYTTASALYDIGACITNSFQLRTVNPATIQGPLPQATNIGTVAAPLRFTVVGIAAAQNPGSGLNPAGPNYYFTPGVAGVDKWWAGTSCGGFQTPDYNKSVNFGQSLNGISFADAAALQSIADAHIAAFHMIEDPALQLGADMAAGANWRVDGFEGMCVFGSPCPGINLRASFDELTRIYRESYLASLQPPATVIPYGAAYQEPGPGQFIFDENTQTLRYKSAEAFTPDPRGWMTAGMYFMNLASKVSLADKFARLKVGPFEAQNDKETETAQAATTAQKAVQLYQTAVDNPVAATQSACGADGVTGGETVDIFKKVIYCVGFIPLGIMDNHFKMQTGRLFAGSGDHLPFSDMVNFGKKLIDVGLTSIKVGLAINVAASGATMLQGAANKTAISHPLISKILNIVTLAKPMIEGAALFVPMFIMFGVLCFLPGFMLFYLLPALPFINFMLGCITWLVSVLQAVIAIPVIAIAHITPHGEGLPSGTARGAYLILLQIFLRPVMMVVGLFAAVLFINTGLVFASMLFVDGTNTSMIGTDPLSELVYFVIYAGVCWGIVHASITCIDEFPMKAVSWIGGGTVDAAHAHQNSLAAVMMTSQVLQQATSSMQGLRHQSNSMAMRQRMESKKLDALADAKFRQQYGGDLSPMDRKLLGEDAAQNSTSPKKPPSHNGNLPPSGK